MHISYFSIYGVTLRLKTNSDRILDNLLKDFRRYEVGEARRYDCEAELIETGGKFPVEIPEYAIRESVLPPNRETYIFSNWRFFEEKNRCIIKLSQKGNEVIGYFRPSYNTSQYARFLLKWLFIKALESKDAFFIHSAGVEKGGVASLFVGPSGFGKSSILISLLQGGYKMISDDTVLIKNGRVLPFHMRSMIHKATLERFPLLEKGLNENSTYIPRQGWLIDLGNIFPVEKNEAKASNILYVYVWNSKETRLEVISKKEMLSRLIHCYLEEYRKSIWFEGGGEVLMKKLITCYTSLLEEISNCYKVFAGSDVTEFMVKIEEVNR